jgi:hypothetical protein
MGGKKEKASLGALVARSDFFWRLQRGQPRRALSGRPEVGMLPG